MTALIKTVKINNKLGMHARPAMLFAEVAGKYNAKITVGHAGHEPVDAKSIMQLMMLAATSGTLLTLTANGEDAELAIEELEILVQNGFNEQ